MKLNISRTAAIAQILNRGNLFNVRNEAETVETLTAKRDEAQAELYALMDDIDERGEAQTEDESATITNLGSSLNVFDQKIQRQLIREVRNEAKNVKVHKLGMIGSAVSPSPTNTGVAIIETDGPGEIEVDAWKNQDDLGYEAHTDFLKDVIEFGSGKGLSRQLEHLTNLGDIGYGGTEVGFVVPKAFMNSCDDGCHMPGDAGLAAIQRRTQEMPVRIPTDESDPLAAVLMPTNVPMSSRDVRIPYLVSKDSRNGVYGNIEVTDMADGECYERLSKFKFGGLRMESKETYTLACFHKQTIDESLVSIESLFRNGSTIAQRRYKLRSLLRGSNTGHYQGVLDSKTNEALIQVGRKQPGKCNFHADDIDCMIEHSWGYGGSFWGVSSRGAKALKRMSRALASAGNAPMFEYNPVTGTGMLEGRPLIVSNEYFGCCELCLINPSQIYHGTYQSAEFGRNPYLMWLCNKELFRITQMESARPAWECPMIQKECPVPVSPFVCLGDKDVFPTCDEFDAAEYRMSCNPCGDAGCSDTAKAETKKAAKEPVANIAKTTKAAKTADKN